MNKKIDGNFYYSHADALADIVNEKQTEKKVDLPDPDKVISIINKTNTISDSDSQDRINKCK